jgi:hypothetical protein
MKYEPETLRGYGFTYNSATYTLVSKPIKNGSYKFLAPVVIGPKTNLYRYGLVNVGGAISNKQVFYTFEKEDNTFLFLNNILNNKFRVELREFYKDYPEAQKLIDTRLKYWLELEQDLNDIVRAVNAS